MALTDVEIRNEKPGIKPVKLSDSGGMFLHITPAGGKLWRLKYRIDGREKAPINGDLPRNQFEQCPKTARRSAGIDREGR